MLLQALMHLGGVHPAKCFERICSSSNHRSARDCSAILASQTLRFEMKLHVLIPTVTIVALLVACSQDVRWDDVSNEFRLVYLDTLTFSEHNLMKFISSDGHSSIVLSSKFRRGQASPRFSDYEILQSWKSYRLVLQLIDEPPTLHIRGEHAPSEYSIDETMVWENDSLLVPVYSSPQIYTKYIELRP